MPKFLVVSLGLALVVGCSSASDADVSSSEIEAFEAEIEVLEARIDELEDLNSDLAAENRELKAASEPATTTTTEAPGPVYDDFSPTCTVTGIPFTGTPEVNISVTNALDERSDFSLLLDLLYQGGWIESGTEYLDDVPAGRTATDNYYFYNAANGLSTSVADYSCEVAEFSIG